MTRSQPYHELHRPQFHFSATSGWINDPNGLVYYAGEYHLFFQHDPASVKGITKWWGHAVSGDLVHWKQLAEEIAPDELGAIWSGSAVVDGDNTTGFQTGDEKPIVCIYTSAGDPFTQSIAYSTDRGRTLQKYDGNPVLGHIRAGNRDPKVVRHEPTGRWIMALFLDENDYILLGSEDLKSWARLSDVHMPETGECPDFFELPVDGDSSNTKWVFWGAAGVYRLGSFDGTTFTPETESLHAEFGANGYAAQTWSDVPAEDGRRIQISWMRNGKYPRMPFNQQMSFPVELTLRTFPEGIRLCRLPVREIEAIGDKVHTWQDQALTPGKNLIPETQHDLFDIEMEVALGTAAAVGAVVQGTDLKYDCGAKKLTYLGKQIPLEPADGRLKLRLLVDRTSLEIFDDTGKMSASFCFLPEACDVPLEFYVAEGTATLAALTVHELRSAWADVAVE